MLQIFKTDVYRETGFTRPPEAEGGQLTAYLQQTPAKVAEGRRMPAVLILPGGAYAWTSPREGEPVAMRFLTRGYQAFVLDYSCFPARFPVSLREAALAMVCIRSHAEEFHVSPDMVAAVGFSAGGHLAGTLATMYDAEELRDIAAAEDLRPDLLLLGYPVAVSHGNTHRNSFENLCGDNSGLMERLSLDHLVKVGMPPVFLWHTRDDNTVPVRNSLLLAQALDEKGVDFSMHIYRHGHHGLSTADINVYPSMYLPDISEELVNWPEEMFAFCREKGFTVKDSSGVKRGTF